MISAPLAAAALFSSAIFWLKSTVSPIGWSVFEVSAFAAWIHFLFKAGKTSEFDFDGRLSLRWLAFIAFSALSLFWTQNIHTGMTSILKLFFCLAVIQAVARDRGAWKNAVEWSVICASILGAAYAVFTPQRILVDMAHPARMPHPNLFSGFIGAGCLLLLHQSASQAGRGKIWRLSAAAGILSAQLVIGSLAPFLAAAGLGLAMMVRSRTLKASHAAVAVAGAMAVLFWLKDPSALVVRKLEDPHSMERLVIWKDSARYFAHHPWVGTGIGTFRDHYPEFKTMEELRLAPYAHSEILNLACEIGVLGMALLLWVLWPILRLLFNADAWSEPWAWVLAALSIQSLFDFNLRYPPILFLFMVSATQMSAPGKSAEAAMPVKSGAMKWGMAAAIGLLAVIGAVPGIAEAYFQWSTRPGSAVSRQEAAIGAARINPFNALYRYESGRMRDISVALELEPRNVWVRKAALKFYLNEWERTRDPIALQEAELQGFWLRKLAPNMNIFEADLNKISEEKAKKGKF